MKFTGLILICASSCLALILPAIGVVQFPKTTQTQPFIAQPLTALPPTFQTSAPFSATNSPGMPQSDFPSSSQWTQSSPQRDFLPNSPNPTTSPFPTPLPQQSEVQAQSLVDLNLPETSAPTGQKFGMGVWLLLAPVCLIGLALWTFSPNPSGGRRVG
jgi:hypothetical protein